jgi:antitoxin VapB
MYMPKRQSSRQPSGPQRRAKLFMNNRSQAVRLPKDFQFNTEEVFIRKEGSEVVLSPRPADWSSYLAEAPVASADFMEGIEDLPVQERKP